MLIEDRPWLRCPRTIRSLNLSCLVGKVTVKWSLGLAWSNTADGSPLIEKLGLLNRLCIVSKNTKHSPHLKGRKDRVP